ncbi:sodium-dependent transporter [Kytococcus sp. Marseille-QA3725]
MSPSVGGASAYRPSDAPARESAGREAFSGRTVFILAAIGSAVGLGNIWRYPYVAYANGGGAFLIPYLVALVTAAIPLLFLDYSLGHKNRGSAPLAFSRVRRWLEPFGWMQALLCFAITTYYAVILAWAVRYFFFSFGKKWGSDTETFFNEDFLQITDPAALGSFVTPTAIALAGIWIASIAIVFIGVDKGIGLVNKIFLPLLILTFAALVIRALFLEGAAQGLDAFFTPDWSAIKDPKVWVAAYGQVFFSTSVTMGAMLTYASYLKRRTNLTGSGLVVGFSNAGFEVLAGIGVFACIGFLATQQQVPVGEAVASGPGLAFVVFPALINEMPFGSLFGALFFGCLLVGGITSLISLMQVVGASFGEKFGVPPRASTLITGVAMAAASMLLYPRTTGLYVLDITDNWVNNVILVGATCLMAVSVGLIARALPALADHLNAVSSFKVGKIWMLCVSVITPLVLATTIWQSVTGLLAENYEGYPDQLLNTFGWGLTAAMVVLSVLLTFVPWRKEHKLIPQHELDEDGNDLNDPDNVHPMEGSRA